ncbi:MAG: hypothetical protein ACK56I_06280, partial [bacterium]
CGEPPRGHHLHTASAYSFQRAQPARTSRDLGDGRCHTCRASRRFTGARNGYCTRLPAWLQPERPARQGCDRRRR